jgi:hypothetical protein
MQCNGGHLPDVICRKLSCNVWVINSILGHINRRFRLFFPISIYYLWPFEMCQSAWRNPIYALCRTQHWHLPEGRYSMQYTAADGVCCARVSWEIDFLLTFVTTPFFNTLYNTYDHQYFANSECRHILNITQRIILIQSKISSISDPQFNSSFTLLQIWSFCNDTCFSASSKFHNLGTESTRIFSQCCFVAFPKIMHQQRLYGCYCIT